MSHATRAALLCGGVPWERISVVQNPVDIEDLQKRARLPLDQELSQRQRPIRILMPALYVKEKGLHIAVIALADITRAGYDACLYFAGEVPFSEPTAYVAEVKQLANRLGVADRVEWLGFRHDVPALIEASTVVILSTVSEGMPRLLLEAMALGRPVISSPVGGNTDLIIHGVTGLFAEPNDPAGFAAALTRCLSRPSEAQWMVHNAKNNIIKQHSIALHTEKLLGVFSRISTLNVSTHA